MTIDTVFHDLSNETKAARISDNRGASNKYVQSLRMHLQIGTYLDIIVKLQRVM